MSDREDALVAAFARLTSITYPGMSAWAASGRRLRIFDDVPAQPAAYQSEQTEQFTQATNLTSKRTLDVLWVIYHKCSPTDPAPTITNSAILDAVELALAPDDFGQQRCTLGGKCHHAWIEGQVFRDAGDLDNQAMVVVPVRIMLP